MSTTKKRIAFAGIVHETNTYCRDETDKNLFHQLRGERILRQIKSDTSLGGALRACDALGFEVVPLMVAIAEPSGSIASDTYAGFKNEILERLESAFPIDGVFLDLHGAGVVTGLPDLEGDLVVAIRAQLGEAVPITASFDLHGNVTQTMADALDGVFACHEYPHIDMHLRAEEAIQLIDRMLKENFRPVIHVETLPMLQPMTNTFTGPGQEILNYMLSLEREEGVIDVSWFHGFPYTDIPHIGSYIVVTTESDREQAIRIAKKGAKKLWQEKEKFIPLRLSADDAVEKARLASSSPSKKDGPIVINETSDNCGGGSPGDGTHLLAAMLNAKLEKACFAFIVDAEVAQQAHQAGVGVTIDISLGAKYDDLHGEPLNISVYVKALHDGRLVMQAMGRGARIHLGPLARLVIEGIDIVVGSRRSQTFDPGPFEAVGIDVKRYPIVALKSSNHFRAGFGDLAAEIITADSPGLTTLQIEVFPREKKSYPLWPIDSDAAYQT
jgi:microcystin degradation protein MlrC